MLERYKTLVTAANGKVHRVEDWVGVSWPT